ncbi:hypothetical protein HNY73_005821 [Argiope bruennichi]|uniref:Uncharacterized protein n=1 Tax=Argiope bruennichi TaxID=94029 RepID=A0A8T0FKX1_ARGBR|nr:hypothetical protein HNY73_005821 [Argiope bruennichi]
MDQTFEKRASSSTGQELLLRVNSPKKPTKPRAKTPQTGPFQDHCGKGDQGSSSEEELMDAQLFQAISNKELETKDQRPNEAIQDKRPTSLSSVQITDEFIAEHILEVTHAVSLKELNYAERQFVDEEKLLEIEIEADMKDG